MDYASRIVKEILTTAKKRGIRYFKLENTFVAVKFSSEGRLTREHYTKATVLWKVVLSKQDIQVLSNFKEDNQYWCTSLSFTALNFYIRAYHGGPTESQ